MDSITTNTKHDNRVALFPIPNMVCFPGTTAPLHVFEPRYRAMIKYCLENELMLAIAHTMKIKSKAPDPTRNTLSATDQLNKNQASYEPHQVFSAGTFDVIETTEDGRMQIEVDMSKRLKLLHVVQEIPFQVVDCTEVLDDVDDATGQQNLDKMQEIYAVLLAISESQSKQLHQIISQAAWRDASPADFSFKVFQYFRFEADFMQYVLEQTSISNRLDLIWQGINQSLQR